LAKKKTMRFSTSVGGPVAADAVAEGIESERLGFDVVWVADHLTDIPPITAVFDAWTFLAYIGAKTSKVKLASGVTDIQRMHPAKTASTVATLDNLTRGRAILGIGSGEVMNTKPYGMEWEPVDMRVKRFGEYLRVVKLLWTSTPERTVSMHGEFYNLTDAHLGLSPFGRAAPPIYVGAFASTAMLRTVGDLADGWFPGIFYTPESFRQRADIIGDAATLSGRKIRDIDLVANVPIILEPDAARLRVVREKFKRSLVISRYMLKTLGADEAYEQVSKEVQYQQITPTREYDSILNRTVKNLRLSDEVLERGIREMMAVGTVDACIDSLEKFVKAGATHLYVSSYAGKPKDMALIAKKILPHFRK
jgi:alkanesulfonate monooxygenase SsuD/methylene tetrahydromethanopterin reductase-like flavin-dependent oxidoreductase (luciferase family)